MSGCRARRGQWHGRARGPVAAGTFWLSGSHSQAAGAALSGGLAGSENHRTRRQRVLPLANDALVRPSRRGLHPRFGQERRAQTIGPTLDDSIPMELSSNGTKATTL